jgi:hypothetical protein
VPAKRPQEEDFQDTVLGPVPGSLLRWSWRGLGIVISSKRPGATCQEATLGAGLARNVTSLLSSSHFLSAKC